MDPPADTEIAQEAKEAVCDVLASQGAGISKQTQPENEIRALLLAKNKKSLPKVDKATKTASSEVNAPYKKKINQLMAMSAKMILLLVSLK